MKEIQEAKTFLEKELGIFSPTRERLVRVVSIAILNNGGRTMGGLFSEAKEALDKLGYPKPENDRIINMMYDIASKNSQKLIKHINSIIKTGVNPGNGLSVNY